MDSARAQRMSEELLNAKVGDWHLIEYIDAGKSALVMKGQNNTGSFAAVKIFDNELIEKFGDDKQLERISREKALIGRTHTNLVAIYDGGVATIGGVKYFYIVMEYLPNRNLAKQLQIVPVENIGLLIRDVARAAKFLLDIGLCHRDIKPENISCDENGKNVKLLDLGVMRPVAGSSITDQYSRPFIGTLQYAAPEYLLRVEKDDLAGWTALTFYQLGAVLHDLIMRVPLFENFKEPFTQLSNAVQNETPIISSSVVPPRLTNLASNCLVKDPAIRIKIVKWSDFELSSPGPTKLEDLKKRIADRATARSSATLQSREDRDKAFCDQIQSYAAQVRESLREECLRSSLGRQLLFGPDETDGTRPRVRLDFETDGNLRANLLIHFELQWLSPGEVIAINAVATISRAKCSANVHCNGPAIYEGAFQIDAVAEKTNAFLYASFEKAQSIHDLDRNWPFAQDAEHFGCEILNQFDEDGGESHE